MYMRFLFILKHFISTHLMVMIGYFSSGKKSLN